MYSDDFKENDINPKTGEVYALIMLGGKYHEETYVNDFFNNFLSLKKIKLSEYKPNIEGAYFAYGACVGGGEFNESFLILKKFENTKVGKDFIYQKIKESELREDNIYELDFIKAESVEREIEKNVQRVKLERETKDKVKNLYLKLIEEVERNEEYSEIKDDLRKILINKNRI